MAETLTELVAKISTDATELKKGLSDAEKGTEQSSQKMSESLKKVGMAMAASGAAVTAAMGFMGKAAIDEEINIKRLATTMKNAGTSYDDVKDSLEAIISTTQRKTGVADDEQRNILNRLILVTNDYNKALELLPTVLDLAAAGEMDATTAATYLGKAYLELEKGAETVSVRFGQASLQFENMEDIQARVAGSAENLVNPLNVLKASMGDVAESIGSFLLPAVKGLVDKVVDIAIKVQEWTTEHPALTKFLTITATAVGILLTVVGGLILVLPAIISGIAAFGVVLHVALGPIGLISLAIAGLIAIGILLWKNWDKVVDFFKGMWINLKIAFAEGVKFIVNTVLLPFVEMISKEIGYIAKGIGKLVGLFNKELGQSIDEFADRMLNAREEITKWADNLAEGARVEKSIRDTQRALKDVDEALEDTTEILAETTEGTEDLTEALEENREALEKQKTAYERLLADMQDTREAMQYERSEAGKLRITIDDVRRAVIEMNWSNEDAALKFQKLGDDSNNVLKVLDAFGITALQVADKIGIETDAINKNAEAYQDQKEAIDAIKLAREGMAEMIANATAFGAITPGAMPELSAAWEAQKALRAAGKWEEAAAHEREIVMPLGQQVWGFQHGGIVTQPTMGLIGEAGPEAIIPLNEAMGGITINFTQPVFFDREDTMNKFVDKIRKGIQRQDRLRFGGAWNG